MATNTYGLRTLTDNWYEDRCQPDGFLSATGGLDSRTNRPLETDLAYIGDRYDVLSRIGRLPARPSFATPDYGFRERLSTNRHDLRDPRTHTMYASKKMACPPFINPANAPVGPNELRPVDGPTSGFGSALKRHNDNHDARFWSTASGEFFGYGDNRSIRSCPSTLRPSGIASEDAENRASGMKCGQLCGESFRNDDNPGMNTHIQRAWLPGQDAALRHIHRGGSKPELPRVDNHLSLPLGDGAMSKVRADLKARSGSLARIATNITKGAHQKSGVSLFQDD